MIFFSNCQNIRLLSVDFKETVKESLKITANSFTDLLVCSCHLTVAPSSILRLYSDWFLVGLLV